MQQQLALLTAQRAALPNVTQGPVLDSAQQQQQQQQQRETPLHPQHLASDAVLLRSQGCCGGPLENPQDIPHSSMTQASEWASVPEPESQHNPLDSQPLPSPDANALSKSAAAFTHRPLPAAHQQQSPAASQHQSPAAAACNDQDMPAAAGVGSDEPAAGAAVACPAEHAAASAVSCHVDTGLNVATASPASALAAAHSPQQTHDAVVPEQQPAAANAVFDKATARAAMTAQRASGSPVGNTAALSRQTHGTCQPAQDLRVATAPVAARGEQALDVSDPHLQQMAGPAVHVSASQSSSYQAAEVLAAMASDSNAAQLAMTFEDGQLVQRSQQAQRAQHPQSTHQGKTVQHAKHSCVAQQAQQADTIAASSTNSGSLHAGVQNGLQSKSCASSRFPLQVVQRTAAVQRQPLKPAWKLSVKGQMSAWGAKGKRKHSSQHASTSKSQQLKKPKCQDQPEAPSRDAVTHPAQQAEKQQSATSSKLDMPADVKQGHDKSASSHSWQNQRGLSSRPVVLLRSTTASPADHAANPLYTEAHPVAARQTDIDSDIDSDSDAFRPVQRGRAVAPMAQPQGIKRHKASGAAATVGGAAEQDMIAGQVYLQWNGHTRQWNQQIIGALCHDKVWNPGMCVHGCCRVVGPVLGSVRWDK